ncbi:T9SS type A sorting domain-containing protein [Massilibacteroides vaginae]|uniref:T9SS type A sorting domain-containing protein n=1 Tax=Massilibacteroides vaginae TaxID=1673718 RepID=UPI000A1C8654|nr:T9SS type A sorting domain-containing protein [Massilibacteroides vaginae]
MQIRIYIYLAILSLSNLFSLHAQTYSYLPSDIEWNANYNAEIDFSCWVFDTSGSWEFEYSIENCHLVVGNGLMSPGIWTGGGTTDVRFKIKLTNPNKQAVVKFRWLKNNISRTTRIWKINVGSIPEPTPTLNLYGPDEMQENTTATFTADYSKHTSSSKYTWGVASGLSIVSGQGTNKVTVRAGTALGSKQISVSTGNLKTNKNVNITSSTLNINNLSITSNKSFSGEAINITNTAILNNAVVSFTANSAVNIKPNFHARQGTTVTITALGNTLHSSYVNNSIADTFPVLDFVNKNVIGDAKAEVRSVLNNNILSITQNVLDDVIDRIEIYNISGALIHRRKVSNNIEDFNMHNCNNGIYIITIHYKRGKVLSRKIILRR